MKQLFYGLAALLLLCGQLSFAREPEKEKPKDLTPPGSAGMVFTTAEEMAGLRLDLILQRKLTLQSRTDALGFEQALLQADIAIWEKDRSELKRNLDKNFGCSFDLDARKCQPKPE